MVASVSPRGGGLAALLLVGWLGAPGCSPTCASACDKLIDECGLEYPEGYDAESCTAECQYQRDRYERIYEEDRLESHLQCVLDTTCEELSANAPCFDEDVYIVPG